MRRVTLLSLFVAVFVLQSAWAVYTQTQKPPRPLRTERVRGDLHIISGEGGNVALYATSDGVILVDDMFDRNHADILAQVKAVTDKLLAQLAEGPTRGYAAIKKSLQASASNTLATQLDLERDVQRTLGYSDDYREGVEAFTAKRPPKFTGR